MTMQTAYSGNTDGKFRAGEYDMTSTSNIAVSTESINDVSNLIFITEGNKLNCLNLQR
jgi:HAE1 family hydrophobic/amphiphilic exporter-1